MEFAIKLNDITKSFGEVKALDGISFDVKIGEWVSVMGPSGSGKSTLVNILSLMDEPTSGCYLLGGDDASRLSDEDTLKFRREKIGLIFQQFHLIPYRPSQLSGGEQQRLCIARALINNPDILIADEPTGNLDEANERVILNLFKELRCEGKTILLITHNPDLGQFGDKIVYLRHGKLESIHYVSDGERAEANEKLEAQPSGESAFAAV